MISKTSVPASFIKGEYYREYTDIVGKYSNYNTMIAEGSIFYYDLLVEEKNLPDAIFYDVNEGERIVSFPVTTESTYGNSIMPSNKVDVYVKIMEGDKVVYGEYFEKIEKFNTNYSPERLEILSNRVEKEIGDYLIYIVAENADDIYKNIVNSL